MSEANKTPDAGRQMPEDKSSEVERECVSCGGMTPSKKPCIYCGAKPREQWKEPPPKPIHISQDELEINHRLNHPRELGYVYRLENPNMVFVRKQIGWEPVLDEKGNEFFFTEEDGSRQQLLKMPQEKFEARLRENTRRAEGSINEEKLHRKKYVMSV